MNISLSLSIDQTNIILGALSEQPFKTVSSTVSEIQQQATAQVKAAQDQERERQTSEILARELYKQELAKDPIPTEE